MNKFIDFIGHGCTGCREEISILNTDRLLQQRINSLLVELIFQLIHHRRGLSQPKIIQIMDSADFDGIQHQRLLQSCRFIDLLLYTGIYLFPETGYAAHQCRADFFNGCLDICRTKVDADLYSFMNTKIAPCLLEYVCQRKEVHRNVLVGHCRQTLVMRMELLQIARMMQHYSLRLSRRTGSIKDVSQIIVRSTCGTFFHHLIMRQSFAHCHKLIKIDGRDITRVFYYRTVENNQLL